MDIRHLTPVYAVSPQIAPSDAAELKARGFVTVICNRPDAEVPPGQRAADIRAAVEAQGMTFVDVPVVHSALTMEVVHTHGAAIDAAAGPVLAYCASGNRSSIVWPSGVDAPRAILREAGYGWDASGRLQMPPG